MKVVLCGYNWIGCKALELLTSRGYEVYVYTHDSPDYVNDLAAYCEKKGIPYTTDRINKDNLPFQPDIICSIYYRYIIKPDVINYVKGKIFNLHPSLLPDYRGCSSLTWAMINGEKYAGFSYHYILQGIDTGNIIIQRTLKIEEWDTQITVYHRAMFEASQEFLNAFDLVCEGYKGLEQNINDSRYYKRGAPHNGEINKQWSDEQTERFIRAMVYPPMPYAKLDGKEIKSFRAFESGKRKAESS